MLLLLTVSFCDACATGAGRERPVLLLLTASFCDACATAEAAHVRESNHLGRTPGMLNRPTGSAPLPDHAPARH